MDLSSLVKNKIVKNIFRIIVIWIIVAVARNFVEEKVENILTILGFIFTILIILGLASYWFWKKYKWSITIPAFRNTLILLTFKTS